VSDFVKFRDIWRAEIDRLFQLHPLAFYCKIDRDVIWEHYLSGFEDPEVRQSFNCNCCKSFIRQFGGLVFINEDLTKTTIWDMYDVDCHPIYHHSLENLSRYVQDLPITDMWYTHHKFSGTDKSRDNVRDIYWYHLSFPTPQRFIKKEKEIPTILGNLRSTKQVFHRALEEITIDSVETVLDLIRQNSLYRGAEFEGLLKAFQSVKDRYDSVKDRYDDNPTGYDDYFVWYNLQKSTCTNIRNSAIGQLLQDLSEGRDLDEAVTAFEKMVAPAN